MWKYYHMFDPDNKILKIGITSKLVEERRKENLKSWQCKNSKRFIILLELPLENEGKARLFEDMQRSVLSKLYKRIKNGYDWFYC